MSSPDRSSGGGPSRAQIERSVARQAKLARIRAQSAREARSIGMVPSLFVQTALPHSDPGDVPVYEARNGNRSLRVRPDFRKNADGQFESTGVPYGSIGRIVIAFITTRARLTGKRLVDFGETQAALLRELDMSLSGGENSRRAYLMEQLYRLAHVTITFETVYRGDDASAGPLFEQAERGASEEGASEERDAERSNAKIRASTDTTVTGRNVALASDYQLWFWQNASGSLDVDGGFLLSDGFFQEIMRSSVPVDLRKLHALRASPLAMDLYVWCTYRVRDLRRSYRHRPLVVSWDDLHAQFGAGYEVTKEFARWARKSLERVHRVWPELRYETPRGRLVLHPCEPDVSER